MMKKPARTAGEKTRKRIVDAALKTLKQEGFAGATSRAIARAGGFNQALIFYHFGSLDGLLLAALDQTSEERLRRYRAAVEEAQTPEELAEVAASMEPVGREAFEGYDSRLTHIQKALDDCKKSLMAVWCGDDRTFQPTGADDHHIAMCLYHAETDVRSARERLLQMLARMQQEARREW